MVAADPLRVLVWSEETEVSDVYPLGINDTIATGLNDRDDIIASVGTLEDEHQGIDPERLAETDCLVWWGHLRHADVTDETVDRIVSAVTDDGLGFIALHSSHYSRPFTQLIDASGDLGDVRTVPGESERLEVRDQTHPIAAGVDDFALPDVEMYGEPFDIPEPTDVVFYSTFAEGGSFRSGVTFERGNGRVFYFRPGHEEFRIYHRPVIRTILDNAVRWCAQR